MQNEAAAAVALRAAVADALRQLPYDSRVLVEMRSLGLGIGEIAGATGREIRDIEQQLHSARNRLLAGLTAAGWCPRSLAVSRRLDVDALMSILTEPPRIDKPAMAQCRP